ncbi:MAG: hypothetical protein ACRBHB_18205 [Arenicella sp.]
MKKLFTLMIALILSGCSGLAKLDAESYSEYLDANVQVQTAESAEASLCHQHSKHKVELIDPETQKTSAKVEFASGVCDNSKAVTIVKPDSKHGEAMDTLSRTAPAALGLAGNVWAIESAEDTTKFTQGEITKRLQISEENQTIRDGRREDTINLLIEKYSPEETTETEVPTDVD